MQKKFKALEIIEGKNGFEANVIEKEISDLPEADSLIKIHYSSLNYKDALSINGHRGITKNYPHIPGIDLSGEVVESKSKNFAKGDKVIVTGYDLGMNHFGGFSEYARVPNEWLVKCPQNLSLKQAMLLGTAGFTAGLATSSVKEFFGSKKEEILVTGIKGGVGMISCFLLKQYGFKVAALTRDTKDPFLKKLPIDQVIATETLGKSLDKPLLTSSFSGVIDNIGGVVFENILKSVKADGLVISCGNVAGNDYSGTVLPLILRAITIKGISSQNTEMKKRIKNWEFLSEFKFFKELENLSNEISLSEIEKQAKKMLEGKHKGRSLISVTT